MSENTRRCTLPGCSEIIEDVPGRPPRRYCTAAHRAAARQARRASMQASHDEVLVATLPWLREPDPEPVGVPAARTSDDVAEPPADAPSADAPSADVPRARPVTGPRPPARAADPERPADNRPSRTRSQPQTRPAPPPARRTRGLSKPLSRRRRVLAVLGVAGILAGGYAVTSAEPAAPPAAPSQAAPGTESEEQWAGRARVALASVNRQLDSIAAVETQWLTLPEEQRAASPTGPVEALMERRDLLERRRATLQSQLEAVQALADVRAGLLASQQYLDAVEQELADAPPESQRTPEQAAAIAALTEQRDLRLRQRDARQQELEALEAGVEDAVARPLPDDVEATAEVGDEVLAIIRGDDPAPPTGSPVPTRPDVVGGRDEQDGAPRQDVATSAPPDPRGPRDESGELRDDPDALASGGIDQPVDAARDQDRFRDAERPDVLAMAPAAVADPVDDAIDDAVDVVEDTVEDGPVAPVVDAVDEVVGGGDDGPVDQVVDVVDDVADGGGDGPVDEVVDVVDGVVGGNGDGDGDRGPVEAVTDTVDGVVGGGDEGPVDSLLDVVRGERPDRADDRRNEAPDDPPARDEDTTGPDDAVRDRPAPEQTKRPLDAVEPLADVLTGDAQARDTDDDSAPVQVTDDAYREMAAEIVADVLGSVPGGEAVRPYVEEALAEQLRAAAPEAQRPGPDDRTGDLDAPTRVDAPQVDADDVDLEQENLTGSDDRDGTAEPGRDGASDEQTDSDRADGSGADTDAPDEDAELREHDSPERDPQRGEADDAESTDASSSDVEDSDTPERSDTEDSDSEDSDSADSDSADSDSEFAGTGDSEDSDSGDTEAGDPEAGNADSEDVDAEIDAEDSDGSDIEDSGSSDGDSGDGDLADGSADEGYSEDTYSEETSPEDVDSSDEGDSSDDGDYSDEASSAEEDYSDEASDDESWSDEGAGSDEGDGDEPDAPASGQDG